MDLYRQTDTEKTTETVRANTSSIIPMSQNHVRAVVDVHLASFPGFFLSFLGQRFLRLLYSSIVSSAKGVGFVFVTQGVVAGFVAGVTNPSGFYSSLIKKQLFAFIWAAMAAAFRHPLVIPRLCRALHYPSQTSHDDACATLMSIGTSPKCRGQGIGKQLVAAFMDEMRTRNMQRVNLTTDRDNNEATNGFYQKLGFKLVRSYETAENRRMNEYEWIFRETAEAAKIDGYRWLNQRRGLSEVL